jgi:hypothetical protein
MADRLCRGCDVYTGYGALGVIDPPPEHALDAAWLASHCWCCGRSEDEVRVRPHPDRPPVPAQHGQSLERP